MERHSGIICHRKQMLIDAMKAQLKLFPDETTQETKNSPEGRDARESQEVI